MVDLPADLTADYAVLNAFSTSLEADGNEFETRADDVRRTHGLFAAALGQFETQAEPGFVAFAASWRAVMDVCAGTSRLCARNAGQLVIDLGATDTAMAGLVIL